MRKRLLIIGIVALLTIALTQLGGMTTAFARYLYSLIFFFWSILLYVSEITYWVVFSAIGVVVIGYGLLLLIMAWFEEVEEEQDNVRAYTKGPVEHYAALLADIDKSKLYQQEIAHNLGTKLVRAHERPEKKRRDIDQLFIDNTLNLPPEIRRFLLDQDRSGETMVSILEGTLTHIEMVMDLYDGSAEEGA